MNYFIVCRQTRCPIFGTLCMNGLITYSKVSKNKKLVLQYFIQINVIRYFS